MVSKEICSAILVNVGQNSSTERDAIQYRQHMCQLQTVRKKKKYYITLDNIKSQCKPRGIIFIMGDLNSKEEKERTQRQKVSNSLQRTTISQLIPGFKNRQMLVNMQSPGGGDKK